MRFIDVLLSFPMVLLAILLASSLGPGLLNLILALGVSQVPLFARLARSLTLSIREREWVEAAICIGANGSHILAKHVFPNMMAPVLIQGASSVALAILYASALNFLGLGVQPPTPDWGLMVSDARRFVFDQPLQPLFPGVALSLSVISVNLLADGLIEQMDPATRGMVG
jgi:peptide/nickel transport system permease protein